MLDFSIIRRHPDQVRNALAQRHSDVDIEALMARDKQRRALIGEVEGLQAERNETSKRIGELKRSGADASEIMSSMRSVGDRIKELEGELKGVEAAIRDDMLCVPNLPHESVPIGEDEASNRTERTWGQPTEFDFEPRDHVELGESLGIFDFARAAKLSGARFSVQFGAGARLERALAAFMLDVHTSHGYLEVLTPLLVTPQAMQGSGQLPKFADDAFFVGGDDLYLIPTSEVPLVNLHSAEILAATDLPVKYCAHTSCFRREAGSYGRDTRGLIRMHQFNKVELVWITDAESSFEALETLTADAERILQGLELPYRVITLSTGDMGFAAAKTYDLEVWLPSQGRYREISSCSNCTDFQARRADIRYRPEGDGKTRLTHTLNGSGIAVGRALVALLENQQQADGTVRVPKALRPYLADIERIDPINRPGG